MDVLSRDKQIDIIAALTEGLGIRATARLTGVNRETVGKLALQVGRGCAELHDRMMVGLRVPRCELDELWAYVGKKQRRMTRTDSPEKGDQYTFVAMASATRAIVTYRTGKRDTGTTQEFIADLRERVIGAPEISTDGFLYSPAAVIAVEREAVYGVPADISTSYVERGNLSIRMASRRFTRLTNGFSKKLENHLAAIDLYVAHYNLCRPHESLTPNAANQTTPAMALKITNRVWSIGELIDAALAAQPAEPTLTPPERRKRFRVIEGGKN
jgi:IS1 family transposase